MTTIVTGAAGFIGSNLVRALNSRGERDVIAVDNLQSSEKFRNLADCEISDFVDKRDFLSLLMAGEFDGGVDAVFHQGACSDTMQTDGRYMMENNYRYSVELLDFCCEQEVPLIYASSAAVYGGSSTFREERQFESPLNIYGYSKFLFDQIVRRRLPDAGVQIAGFRYFNVYGRNEAHKTRMASVAWHFFNQYQSDGCVHPFQGSGGYEDGEQRRDFIAVEDIVRVNLWFLDHPHARGIFNVGTGRAQSFNDVAVVAVNACRAARGESIITLADMREKGIIGYRDFPETLKGKYQHFTQADMDALRQVGYQDEFASVEQGVTTYCEWLLQQRSG
ncbi:MAG: ADP-glyceromanno-heptose 6-epimerase [Betaproteobacteria bacterium]|nr:ADP-glyceromanno-heptose 6-epimerase [Betaproteobacteria bacterium]